MDKSLNDVQNEFSRTELLLGDEAIRRLAAARVAVFGAGGVGGYVIEALARGGIGSIDIIDDDTVSASNINRQIFALHSTIGRYKAELAKERAEDINPEIKVSAHKVFYTPETSSAFDLSKYDYVVDAIDTVSGKIELAVRAFEAGTKIISSMGTGNKLDPTAFKVADITKTSVCPLARVMRRELKKRGITHLKVVYSEETPITPDDANPRVPGSVSFVPPVAGLIIAGEVIKDIGRVHDAP